MKQSILETREDMEWLFTTHLKAFRHLLPESPRNPFVAAIVFGNEDAPDTIDVYSENHYQAPYLRFARDEAGEYYCVGVRRA